MRIVQIHFSQGHDLGLNVELLMSRLEKLKVPMWSRTSRLRRTVALQKVGLSKAAHWELTAGRLLLDSRSSAMELVRSRSFDLTELASRLLKTERQELLAGDIGAKFAYVFFSLYRLKLFFSSMHSFCRLSIS